MCVEGFSRKSTHRRRLVGKVYSPYCDLINVRGVGVLVGRMCEEGLVGKVHVLVGKHGSNLKISISNSNWGRGKLRLRLRF